MRIYLDTTIPNYYFNDYVADKQRATQRFFSSIKGQKIDAFISDMVLQELMATSDSARRDKLANLVKDLPILDTTEECIRLADEYLKNNIIPKESRNDALHIAIASIFEMDFLVSYNFEHIVKVKTVDKVTGVNLLCGYKTPRIVSVEEVLDV